jgi:hypothetical protein
MRVLIIKKDRYDIMNFRGGIYNFDVSEGYTDM